MADSSLNIYTGPTSQEKPEKKKKKKPELPVVSIKNAADYQRMKLDRLFANPDKPVVLPIRPKDKNLPPPPEFVRNVMGSSAGAGSGEFHVYRHLRRKEYARQKGIVEKAKFEELDDEYQRKLDENKKLAELKTAKKRAKRLKKKQNLKKKKGNDSKEKTGSSGGNKISDSSSNDSNSLEESGDEKSKKEKDAPKSESKISAGQKNGSSDANKTQTTSNRNIKSYRLSSGPRNSESESGSDD